MTSTNTYRDYLSHHNTQSLAHGIFNIVDGHQRCDSKEVGFASVAAAFVLMAKELGLSLDDALRYTHNSLAHIEQTDTETYRAIREYFKNEV